MNDNNAKIEKDELVSCADEALYNAKNSGKNYTVIKGIKDRLLEKMNK